MNKLSALMLGAAMILGTALCRSERPQDRQTRDKSTTTKKVKKHHTKTKKSAKNGRRHRHNSCSREVTIPARFGRLARPAKPLFF